MKRLAEEAEEPGVVVPLVARVVQVEVPIRVIAVEVGHVAVTVHDDQPIYKMSSMPPPFEYPTPLKTFCGTPT